MTVIKPTKKEVFDDLKMTGCCWLGRQGCECFSGIKNQGCYDSAEKRLTRTIYTPEEIEAMRENNKKAMAELHSVLADMFDIG